MSPQQPIDWAAVRRELAATDRRLEGWGNLSPRAEIDLLRERARLLAREPERDDANAERVHVLEFQLGNNRYAFELDAICEVTRDLHLTRVPCTPAFVLGIINLRGEILTVINLARLFELPADSSTPLGKIIVLQAAGLQLGIAADAIVGVRSLRLSELHAAPATLTGFSAEHVRGVTSERVVVLHVGKVLSDSRLLVQDAVES